MIDPTHLPVQRFARFMLALALSFAASAHAAANPAPVATTPQVTQAALAAVPPGEVMLVGRDAAGVESPSAANAWGGARTASEATLSDRVVAYQIQATLDPVRHSVDGHELLTWRNRSSRPISSVYMHLYLNAFEGNQSTFFSELKVPGFGFRSDVATRDGEWGHIEVTKVTQNNGAVAMTFVHPDGGPTTDHTVVRFDLPTAVAPGASTTLDISFRDQLPRVVARTGYFGTFHLIGQWFPKIAVLELPGERGATAVRWNAHEFHLNSEFYADYGTFDVQLTVPKDYTVGAVGEEVEPAKVDGAMATHHFMQADVHDFAWTADNRTAPVLQGTYTGPGSPVVTVRVLFPPEERNSAAGVLKATLDSLAYFSKTVGPYPYKTVTAVLPPYNAGEAGGMEYPTFFTVDNFVDTPPGTALGDISDFTTIHEFGHGYFYGILGSNEFEEPMLDEGINEYWDMRMMGDRHQDVHWTLPLLKKLGMEIDSTGYDFERLSAQLNDPTDGSAANSWNRFSSSSYNSVYSHTALLMHDLEMQIGRPAMEKAMHAYYETWKFRHPSIADLREILAANSGQPELVRRVFDQQVYHVSRIDDSVDSLISDEILPETGTHEKDGQWIEDDSKSVAKKIEETRTAWAKEHPHPAEGTGPFPYRTLVTLKRFGAPVPEKVLVKFADGTSETVTWDDDQRWARFAFIKPVKAVSAEIDPEHVRLLDANKFNDGKLLEPSHAALFRITGDIAAWFQTLFALVITQ